MRFRIRNEKILLRWSILWRRWKIFSRVYRFRIIEGTKWFWGDLIEWSRFFFNFGSGLLRGLYGGFQLEIPQSFIQKKSINLYSAPTRPLLGPYSAPTRHLLSPYSAPTRHLLGTYSAPTRPLLGPYSTHHIFERAHLRPSPQPLR